MSVSVLELPPNGVPRFYRGGAAISELRGFEPGGERVPEEWIGSTTTVFGEPDLGLSRLPDGTLLREAIAADPEGWLGPDHVARFGADPALLVKLLDAGQRLPVHLHPDGAFAGEHLGTRFGKTEAWIVIAARPGAQVHVGFKDDVPADTVRAWVQTQDHDAMLGALNPVDVTAGDAIFVPAGVAHAIGEGLLIVELQEPTDMSILLEWDGFGIADEAEATLGLGWDTALGCVERDARDPAPLRGSSSDGAVAELLPRQAHAFFSAQRVAPAGDATRLEQGFAVVVVLEGAGTIAGRDVERGAALLVPHAAGAVTVEGELTAIACRPPAVGAVGAGEAPTGGAGGEGGPSGVAP
ncbi:MAG TPA: class I mannose-6-phosphate isomerase [Solirubrobacteraceae bacterium]